MIEEIKGRLTGLMDAAQLAFDVRCALRVYPLIGNAIEVWGGNSLKNVNSIMVACCMAVLRSVRGIRTFDNDRIAYITYNAASDARNTAGYVAYAAARAATSAVNSDYSYFDKSKVINLIVEALTLISHADLKTRT